MIFLIKEQSFQLLIHYYILFSLSIVLPTSSKQKLQALAKDELLASLNVPLSNGGEIISVVDDDDEEILDDPVDTECHGDDEETKHHHDASRMSDEYKAQVEKERRDTKRMLIIEEILETEKNYISCLDTLDAVS